MKTRKIIQTVEYDVAYDTEEGLQKIMEELWERTINDSSTTSNDEQCRITVNQIVGVEDGGVEVKVGHYYRTRGGEIAFINSKLHSPVKGFIGNDPNSISWMEDGRYLEDEDHEFDLVEELSNEN